MTSAISAKIREALAKFNDDSAARLGELLAKSFEKVEEEKARDTVRAAMNVMSFLPSLILLITNLTIDMRVPLLQKLNIALMIAFLIVPDDAAVAALIGPVAFLDDTVILLYTLFLIVNMIGSLEEQVIRDNWVGDPAQADELVKAAAALGSFLGARIPLEQAQAIINI